MYLIYVTQYFYPSDLIILVLKEANIKRDNSRLILWNFVEFICINVFVHVQMHKLIVPIYLFLYDFVHHKLVNIDKISCVTHGNSIISNNLTSKKFY